MGQLMISEGLLRAQLGYYAPQYSSLGLQGIQAAERALEWAPIDQMSKPRKGLEKALMGKLIILEGLHSSFVDSHRFWKLGMDISFPFLRMHQIDV